MTLSEHPRRNAPPGHIVREMTRLFRARERDGVAVWDLPHFLVAVHWDGRRMWTGAAHRLAGVRPDDYPQTLARLGGADIEAQRELAEQGQAPTLYAYLMVCETHHVSHDPQQAQPLEERRFQRDRRERRFYQRPDAREMCQVLAADIDGRVWMAERDRDRPRRLERLYWPDPEAGCLNREGERCHPGGALMHALRALTGAAAMLLHGDVLERGGQGQVVELGALR